MVVPFAAVTITLISVTAPSASAMGGETVPEARAVPFTFMVALGSIVTGLTVMLAVAFDFLRRAGDFENEILRRETVERIKDHADRGAKQLACRAHPLGRLVESSLRIKSGDRS